MHALRFPLATGSGLFVALALFALLSTFIGRAVAVDPVAISQDVRYTRPLIEPPVPPKKPRERILNPPERPLISVPGIRGVDKDDIRAVLTGATAVNYVPYKANFEVERYKRPAIGQDRDVIPLVRVPPDYPPGANTEGWVEVQFSITSSGTVRDAFVVDASPKGVFDAAALKAIGRWRYNPKIEGGVAVERVGLQTLIRFELQ